MHEAKLMRQLIQQVLAVADEAGATRVTRVEVTLGALSHCTPEHFREHYRDVAVDTIAADAELVIHTSDDPTDAGALDIRIDSVGIDEGSEPAASGGPAGPQEAR